MDNQCPCPCQSFPYIYSYEAKFIHTFRYITDVLSINNPKFTNRITLIYPKELEKKEATETASSASFLDIYFKFDTNGQLSTTLYDKKDNFKIAIINFQQLDSNIPTAPVYGVYI